MRTFVFACLIALSGAACAGSAKVVDDYQGAKTVDERLSDMRAVLRNQRGHRFAGEMNAELERAGVWIDRADRMVADGEGHSEKVELYLQAIEGQLVLVRSHYARREAEAQLESTRAGYEGKAAELSGPTGGAR